MGASVRAGSIATKLWPLVFVPLAVGGGLALEAGTPRTLDTLSAVDLLKSGPGGATTTAQFEFKNVTSQEHAPTMRWTDCGCSDFRFEPERVGPGEVFHLHVEGKFPVWVREQARLYRVGLSETTPDLDQTVRLRLRREEERWLAVAPECVTGRWLSSGGLELVLDVAYESHGEVLGDPARDLDLDTELGPIQLFPPEDIIAQGRGRFSGVVRLRIIPRQVGDIDGIVVLRVRGAVERVVKVHAAAKPR